MGNSIGVAYEPSVADYRATSPRARAGRNMISTWFPRTKLHDLPVHLVLAPAVLDLEDPDVGIVLHLAFDIGVGLGLGDGLGASAAAPGRGVGHGAGLGVDGDAF